MSKKHEATLEELEAAWERVQDFWNKMNAIKGVVEGAADVEGLGMMDYPWVRARFKLNVFNTMLSQRGWKVPTMLGGRSSGV